MEYLISSELFAKVLFCFSFRHVVDPPPVADSSDEENTELSKKKSASAKTDKSRVVDIPESLRFDPKSMENKPKGLVDSLTKYFTPGKSMLAFV